MKKMGNENLKFIGRFWNGEPKNSLGYSRKELYFDPKNSRYVKINESGIDCFPKSPLVEYLSYDEAKNFALNKLSYTEYRNHFETCRCCYQNIISEEPEAEKLELCDLCWQEINAANNEFTGYRKGE